MSILGVNIRGDMAWLALIENEGGVAATPDRYTLPKRPRPDALEGAIDDLALLLKRHSTETVVVLDAHGSTSVSLKQARRRIVVEILLELAAARSRSSFLVISPALVQSRLGLPTRRLAEHVDVIPSAGTRWTERGPGALAALAVLGEHNDP